MPDPPQHLVVLDAHDGVLVVFECLQLGDVVKHQHVEIHEQNPAFETTEIRRQKAINFLIAMGGARASSGRPGAMETGPEALA